MSTSIANLVARLTFDGSQFVAGIKAATTEAATAGARMSTAGRTMTKGVTLPLLAIGAGATAMAMQFETAFAHMEGLAGVPADELGYLREQVLALSEATAQSPQALAEGLYFIESSGIKGANAMRTLDAAARAATAGLGSVETVADALTSAMNAYGQENLTAASAANVMVGAVREGKGEADQLAGSLGRVIPVAANLGVSFQQVGAGMAGLTRIGLSAAESATALRSIMMTMLGPTEQAREALAGIGMTAGEIRTKIADEGLLTTLLDLKDRLHGNAAAMSVVFGNVRAMNGVMSLIGANADEVDAIFRNLTGDTDYLGEAFDAVAKTDAFKVRQAIANLQAAMINLGAVIAPVVGGMADGFANAASVIANLPDPVAGAVVAFAGLAAAAGPVLMIAGSIANGWAVVGPAIANAATTATTAITTMNAASIAAAATNPVLLGLAAAAGATALALGVFGEAQQSTKAATEDFTQAIQSQGDALAGLGAALQSLEGDSHAAGGEELMQAMQAAGKTVDDLRAALNGGADDMADFAAALDNAGGVSNEMVGTMEALGNMLTGQPTDERVDSIDRITAALENLKSAQTEAEASAALNEAVGISPDTSGVDAATGAFEGLDVAADDAATSVDMLNAAWSGLNAALSASEATLAARDALRSLGEETAKAAEDGDVTAAEFDAMHGSLNGLADALMKQAEASNTAADGSVNADKANRDLLQSMQYLAAAGSIPESLAGEWQALIDTLTSAPDDVTVDVSAPNAYPTRDQLIAVYVAAAEATQRVDVTTAAPGSDAAAADLNAVKAAADRIPGYYPAYVDTLVERAAFDQLVRDLDAADNRRFQMQVSVNTSNRPQSYFGGPVPGRTGEAVPMTLHGGEYVLSSDVVDRIRSGSRSRGASMGTSAGGQSGEGGDGRTVVILAKTVGEAVAAVPADARPQVRSFLEGRS